MWETMILENLLEQFQIREYQTPSSVNSDADTKKWPKTVFPVWWTFCEKKNSRINKTKESIFNVTFKQPTYVFVFIYSWRNIRKCKDLLLVAHKKLLYFFLFCHSFRNIVLLHSCFNFGEILLMQINVVFLRLWLFSAMKRWNILFKWFNIMKKRNEDGIFINVCE